MLERVDFAGIRARGDVGVSLSWQLLGPSFDFAEEYLTGLVALMRTVRVPIVCSVNPGMTKTEESAFKTLVVRARTG
jgi:hypothetical protein